ncbi:MAG: hypothetical protein J7604_23380 [Sporocytophaga sp.]|uniref:hypothetical protein n=1 Tax=Sporocytophaga sp. TaxID=2231183 RepID=UPI001B215C7B|nr:hypothetical protein [Sporocytophaga sp.]MBO9703176.1 hypothetical protein [Sporocytophaga sp.]
MNKIFIAFILAFMISSNTFGQVGKIIKELGEVQRKERYSSSGSIDGTSEWLLLEGFRLVGIGIYNLQTYVLSTRDEHPEVVSMEGFLQGGYYGKYNAILLTPQIRANWGAFSSEFRQQSINDNTGYLSTLDWQIIKLNIPIYPLMLNGGMGFSHLDIVKQTFFEYTLGAQSRFLRERLYTEVVYRSADGDRTSFRKEFKITCDYEIGSKQVRNRGSFRICPSLGFTYQNYYGRFNQYYLMAGLNLRYY